jgi:hypothetical protein
MRTLLLSVILFAAFSTFAKHINEQTAKQVGQQFLMTKTRTLTFAKTVPALDLVYKMESANQTGSALTQSKPITFFYVFNAGSNGFIVISGDDQSTPVLAYSDVVSFDPNNIPPNTQKWLEEYKKQIHYIIANNISPTEDIQSEWDSYQNGTSNVLLGKKAAVTPMLQTKWNQSPNYNQLCPYDNQKGERAVTGCVATAMAQVMNYWKYPATGTGFYSYNHSKYGTLNANFGSTTYDWNNMPNQLTGSSSATQKTALATLMYHCGVSVEMNYGVASDGGSGAFVITTKSPVQHCSEYAFRTYFGYKSTTRGVERASYTQQQWINLLKTELEASRPILYAGFGSGGGHAFVCDGYDNNDMFHFNWGWGGNSDGYFQINALNPAALGAGGGSGGFNSGHQAVIGIEPGSNGGGGGGGGGTQNHDLRLFSSLNLSETNIWFGQPFSLSVNIANHGENNFTGKLGAAIFDNNYKFVTFMDSSSQTIQTGYYNPITFSRAGSVSLVPGTYYVAVYYKTATQDWTIVSDGSYNNVQQFNIRYSATIEVNSNFVITGDKLTKGKMGSVNVDVRNAGQVTFNGKYRVDLMNASGTAGQTIQVVTAIGGLPVGYHYTNGLAFSGAITVEPGTYLMSVAFQKDGETQWYYAGSTDHQNPVYVIVDAPDIEADMYEENDEKSSAYLLSANFSGNQAAITTTGSNIHLGTDLDYYKIELPAGYDYIITPRIHDALSSSGTQTYTIDALFSVSLNNTNIWSETYDDVMPTTINMDNGGTLYFKVAPYFSGNTGTYLLEMEVNRTKNTGVNDVNLNSVNVYPNPAKDVVMIDVADYAASITGVSLYNIQGQEVYGVRNYNGDKLLKIDVNELAEGFYFLHIHSTQGTLTKKILIKP